MTDITGRTAQDSRGSCGDAAGLSLARGPRVPTGRAVFPARASSVTSKGGRGRARGVMVSGTLAPTVTSCETGRLSGGSTHEFYANEYNLGIDLPLPNNRFD